MPAHWYVCEAPAHRSKGGFCLYTDRAAAKIEARQGLARCIKHGALLGHDCRLNGKTRDDARRYLKSDATDADRWSA